MIAQALLGIIGLASGLVVAGGVIALMIGLGVVTRYAGITHTAKHVWLYEDAILFGGVFGNWLSVYQTPCPLGWILLAVLGVLFGIFVGGWIMALAEIVNIFPIMARRIGMVKGMSLVVIAIAVGKTLGSLWHFYMRW
ncbi:MAG: stage V sporulation protein AB [Eubacteriales bacterium]|nr:stage V sporulation protein AB [Eubacteriales bacterium]